MTSNFLFLAIIIYVLLFTADARLVIAEPSPNVCFSSCGNIKNISYPFRLRGDPAGCGLIDYQLSCENNQTILEYRSGKYVVKGIWYDEQTIKVVDFNLANGSCSLPYSSLSVSHTQSDLFYEIPTHILFVPQMLSQIPKSIDFLDYPDHDFVLAVAPLPPPFAVDATFMRCTSQISKPTYISLYCLNQNGSYFYVALASDKTQDLTNLPKSCYFLSTVPAFFDFEGSLLPLKSLQTGFNLSWSLECTSCRLAGGECTMMYYSCYKEGK